MDQTSDFEQCSNRLELDLISLLVNFSCEWPNNDQKRGDARAVLDLTRSHIWSLLEGPEAPPTATLVAATQSVPRDRLSGVTALSYGSRPPLRP